MDADSIDLCDQCNDEFWKVMEEGAMAIKVTCDKCGKTLESECQRQTYYTSGASELEATRIDLCDQCDKEFWKWLRGDDDVL